MKNSSWFLCVCLMVSLLSGCSGQFPNAQRTLFAINGYGVQVELLSSSASAPKSGVESEVNVGKWASSAKRGSAQSHGLMAPPGAPPGSWTAVTGAAGVITVNRIEAIPTGANSIQYRAIDTVNPANVFIGGTLTGLVSGRIYKVQAAWYLIPNQVSDWSASVNVAAG